MTDLPERVYLVTVDGEWPVSAIIDDHSSTAERVEREVQHRSSSRNVLYPSQVHVWCADLANAREVDLMPTSTVRAAIRERGDHAPSPGRGGTPPPPPCP